MQTAHYLDAGQRPFAAVARTQRHQAGHLVLREADLLTAARGELDVGDLVGKTAVEGHVSLHLVMRM